MTRFVISLDEGVSFVLNELQNFSGGEIFVPKLASIRIVDLVEAMLFKDAYKVIGIRAGEKLHEVMIPKEEARNCIEIKDKYIIIPQLSWWNRKIWMQIFESLVKMFQTTLNIRVIKIQYGYL